MFQKPSGSHWGGVWFTTRWWNNTRMASRAHRKSSWKTRHQEHPEQPKHRKKKHKACCHSKFPACVPETCSSVEHHKAVPQAKDVWKEKGSLKASIQGLLLLLSTPEQTLPVSTFPISGNLTENVSPISKLSASNKQISKPQQQKIWNRNAIPKVNCWSGFKI